MGPSSGKIDKKHISHQVTGIKQPYAMTEPFFYLSAGELCAFFQLSVFQPTVGNLMGEAFYWLSFGLFRKNGNHLLWQRLSLCMKRLCHICDCFISTARWKYSLFLLLSHRRNPRLRHFAGCSFGTSRNKQQPFSITRAIRLFDGFQKNSFWIL